MLASAIFTTPLSELVNVTVVTMLAGTAVFVNKNLRHCENFSGDFVEFAEDEIILRDIVSTISVMGIANDALVVYDC